VFFLNSLQMMGTFPFSLCPALETLFLYPLVLSAMIVYSDGPFPSIFLQATLSPPLVFPFRCSPATPLLNHLPYVSIGFPNDKNIPPPPVHNSWSFPNPIERKPFSPQRHILRFCIFIPIPSASCGVLPFTTLPPLLLPPDFFSGSLFFFTRW